MSFNRGTIVLMGSGELTATMVELHKARLRPFGPSGQALFIDTPAGFQLNVDNISKRAIEHFKLRVQKRLLLASFKSAAMDQALTAQQTFAAIRKADYILIGPGSPTYALQHWRQSPIPQLLKQHIEKGGCLVSASAAALTMGRLTLPVYEIYKVGQPVHWVEGLDILGHFGMNLVVFPHWNNAEGGNHDTRYCFMGSQRLQALERLMPPSAQILGLDEHTALIIDFAQPSATVYGIGCVTLRRAGRQWVFKKGDKVPLSLLRGQAAAGDQISVDTKLSGTEPEKIRSEDDIWATLHGLADQLRRSLDQGFGDQAGALVLEMERRVWQARDLLEEQDGFGAARELFREMVALLVGHVVLPPVDHNNCLAPLVEPILELRSRFRHEKKWAEADALRHCLQKARIIVEDTPAGSKWTFENEGKVAYLINER